MDKNRPVYPLAAANFGPNRGILFSRGENAVGQRLDQVRSFAEGRRLFLTGRLGSLGSRVQVAVDQVKVSATGPAGRLVLASGDGLNLVELQEEEISQVLPRDGGRSLLLLLDGGTELALRPQVSPPPAPTKVEGVGPTMVE